MYPFHGSGTNNNTKPNNTSVTICIVPPNNNKNFLPNRSTRNTDIKQNINCAAPIPDFEFFFLPINDIYKIYWSFIPDCDKIFCVNPPKTPILSFKKNVTF
jgi:hypothetical protein